MKPIKLSVVGAGLIGKRHAELVNQHPNSELVALCDTAVSCKPIADNLGVPFYEDAEEMLRDHQPEGVIIATSTTYHAPIAHLCIAHDAHILLEKPITATLAEGEALIKHAKQQSVQVLVGHYRRYHPLLQRAQQLIAHEEIGPLVSVMAMWHLYKPTDYYNVTWRTVAGGGPVMINLIHDIDCLRFTCGDIAQVYAMSSSSIRNLSVEDTACITFKFASGALGTLSASDTTPAPWSYEATMDEDPKFFHVPNKDHLYFLGTKGSLAFPSMQLWRYPEQGPAGWLDPLESQHLTVPPQDPLSAQLDHFCRVVRQEENPFITGEDGLKTLRATLAVRESAAMNAPVSLL